MLNTFLRGRILAKFVSIPLSGNMRAYVRVLQSAKAPSFIIKNCSASTKAPAKAPTPDKAPTPAKTPAKAPTPTKTPAKASTPSKSSTPARATAKTPAPPPQPKKLPVPSLVPTLRKYLTSCRPFLSSDEFIKTEEIVKEFMSPGGHGETLHELLEEKARSTENWLEEWFLNTAYLGYRNPVVVYSSPGQVFPWQLLSSDDDYLMCAAKVILGALDYKKMIDDGKIKQEMLGNDALDMSQYYNVFGTNRSPSIPLDRLFYYPKSEHIVIISNNSFFKLCYKSEGKLLDLSALYHQLRCIFDDSKEPGCRIGILTTDNRDNWAEAYDHLVKDPMNCRSLKEVEESLFVVCLDRNCPKPLVNNQTTTAAQLIHGGGVSVNSANRWYDKTLQFVIGRDGGIGIAYEHSPAEGVLIASLMDHISNLLGNKACYNDRPANLAKPTPLCFSVDECLNSLITRASNNLTDLVENLELCCFSFDDYGKEQIKQFKVSPDSFIQMAIQYAFYRIHKVPGAHYETASLRRFKGGRTETIRSCSEDSITFAKAMLNESLTCITKARALIQAIESHKEYTIDAMDMKAVDRFLLGLRLIAEERCLPRPPLLDDPAFERSTHFRLSTSQVPSKADGFMVYAPLTEDGYGCCYNPRDNNINFGTSAFRCTGETSAPVFRENLELALRHMKQVMETPVAKL